MLPVLVSVTGIVYVKNMQCKITRSQTLTSFLAVCSLSITPLIISTTNVTKPVGREGKFGLSHKGSTDDIIFSCILCIKPGTSIGAVKRSETT